MTFTIISTDNMMNRFDQEIPEDIKTWGQLKDFISNKLRIAHDKFKPTFVIEGHPLNNMSPDDNEAVIPESFFVLSFSPKDTKFGAVSYGEMKAYIKAVFHDARTKKDSQMLDLIGDYTRLKTEEMVTLYNQVKQVKEGTQIVHTTTLVPDSSDIYAKIAILNKKLTELMEQLSKLEVRLCEVEEELFDENLRDDEDEEIEEEVDEKPEHPFVTLAKRKLNLI